VQHQIKLIGIDQAERIHNFFVLQVYSSPQKKVAKGIEKVTERRQQKDELISNSNARLCSHPQNYSTSVTS